NYKKTDAYEMPSKESLNEGEPNYGKIDDYDEDLFDKEEADYKKKDYNEIPIKDSFDENTDYYETPNEELINEIETDYEKTDNYVAEIDFFSDDDEILVKNNKKIPSEKEPDKVVDQALNNEQTLSIVNIDGKLKATVQHVLTFNELPYNLQSNNQRKRSYSELCLLDRKMDIAIIVIELQYIVKVAPIVILYNEDNFNSSSIFIQEILYKYQGHWKLKSVKYFYKHSSEFAALEIPKTNLPIYKLYIDFYYNDFGTFYNVYHSLGDVQRKKSLVIASFGDVIANLLQENNLARDKRHGAIRECRTCNVAKNFWTSKGFDLLLVSHYHHITNSRFEEIFVLNIVKRHEELATKYGLCLQESLLDKLKRERHLQSPQDVYYITASKV
ncbi:41795_t:CDS:2, partial [Gigaspora margarita]